MSATDFELRHQTLLHPLLVSLAFLTYFLVRDDIVWALVKNTAHPHLLERSLFAVATLLIGAAAAICTWARASPGISPSNRGPGFSRFSPDSPRRTYSASTSASASPAPVVPPLPARQRRRPQLEEALRQESAKWGLVLTMIIFTVLLVDRVAEIFAVASLLLWLLLNLPSFIRAQSHSWNS